MIDIMVKTFNNTHAIIIEDEIVDFTTVYDEVEELIENWCEENDVDTWDINLYEN